MVYHFTYVWLNCMVIVGIEIFRSFHGASGKFTFFEWVIYSMNVKHQLQTKVTSRSQKVTVTRCVAALAREKTVTPTNSNDGRVEVVTPASCGQMTILYHT